MIDIYSINTYPILKDDKFELVIVNKNTYSYDLSSFYIKKERSNKKSHKVKLRNLKVKL